MAKTVIDFRFVELRYELWCLKQYRQSLERQLEIMWKNAALLAGSDPDYELADQERRETVESVIPRYYRGPFLITLWSVFESGIFDISRYIAEKKGVALNLSDIKGDTPRERWNKYFTHVLKWDLGIATADWTRLREIQDLRNAIAHTNGRITLLNDTLARKIRSWAKQNRGIKLRYDLILLSAKYIDDAGVFVDRVLSGIVERVLKET